jgi:hypothetical protein
MTIQTRLIKLEKERKSTAYTWREFIEGTAEIDPETWREFISEKESEHEHKEPIAKTGKAERRRYA